MNLHTIIKLEKIVPRFEQYRFKNPINWEIKTGEHWAVIGPNGGGKTLLIDILTEKHALHYDCKIVCQDAEGNDQSIRKTIKSVAFKDIYSIVDAKNSYYQQRWNKGLDENNATVKQLVEDENEEALNELIKWFAIEDLMNKEVNQLSSGELRKFLIVRSLLASPKILILDNPFIGLDAPSRLILNDLLENLVKYRNLQIFLIVSDPKDIPNLITHILSVKNKEIQGVHSQKEFFEDEQITRNLFNITNNSSVTSFPEVKDQNTTSFENAVILNKVNIKYGERTILNGLDWKLKKGEKWALMGANGSGKSTLLSLICGDNPQAYANDITLFDRKRGTGESIWDIKKKIGYISPEMHLYYLKNVRCLDVVGSGFFDTIGLYRKCSALQEITARKWMEIFGIEHLENTSFLNISNGEQRLVLLARVLVKNPDLLILDEPLHGLDVSNKQKVIKIIEEFCDDSKSLIYVTHYEEEIPSVVNQRLTLTKQQ